MPRSATPPPARGRKRQRPAGANSGGRTKATAPRPEPVIVLSDSSSIERSKESMETSEQQDSEFEPAAAESSDDDESSDGDGSGSEPGDDSTHSADSGPGDVRPHGALPEAAPVKLSSRLQRSVGYKVHEPLPMARPVPPTRRQPAASASASAVPQWLLSGRAQAAPAQGRAPPSVQRTYTRAQRQAPAGTGASTATEVEMHGGQGGAHAAGSGTASKGGDTCRDVAAVDSPPTEEDGPALASQGLGQQDRAQIHGAARLRAPVLRGAVAASSGIRASRAAAGPGEPVAAEPAAKQQRVTGEPAAQQLPPPGPALRPAAGVTRPQQVCTILCHT